MDTNEAAYLLNDLVLYDLDLGVLDEQRYVT